MISSIPQQIDWQAIQRYLELLQVLTERNLKVRYRGSILGIYWSLLNPLIMTGIYTAIFGAVFAEYYGDSIVNYVLAAFTGLVVIQFFSASTSQALSSVVGNGGLLNKIQLPISAFPLSMISANVFQFSVGVLPLLIIVTLINAKSIVNVFALFFPFLSLILFCTGVGFFLSTLYVFFRDLPYFYELITFLSFFTSPIFYPAEIVPEQVRSLLQLNPLAPIIESLRQISLYNSLPDFPLATQSVIGSLITLGLGWVCFQYWKNQFVDML